MSLKKRISRLEDDFAWMGFRDYPQPSPDLWFEQMCRRGREQREAEAKLRDAKEPHKPASPAPGGKAPDPSRD